MIEVTVEINLKGLKKFNLQMNTDLQGSTNGPIRKAINQWGYRFRAEMQQRFAKFSKGGGKWPPLSQRTLKARRKGKGSGTPAILRDKGLLFTALSPAFANIPGQLNKTIPFGVEVGYGGPAAHGSGGKATIADIASFHQVGAGYLPIRTVIESPSRSTISDMAADMQRALKKLSDGTIEGQA